MTTAYRTAAPGSTGYTVSVTFPSCGGHTVPFARDEVAARRFIATELKRHPEHRFDLVEIVQGQRQGTIAATCGNTELPCLLEPNVKTR